MIKKIIVFLGFGILFFLSAASGKLLGYLLFPLGVALGIGHILLLGVILKVFNGKVVRSAGALAVESSVYNGFILIIPFVIFSALAVWLFGAGSALPFMSAGLTICGGAVGMEIIKKGGGKVVNMLIPSIYCMLTSVLLSYLVSFIVRGGKF